MLHDNDEVFQSLTAPSSISNEERRERMAAFADAFIDIFLNCKIKIAESDDALSEAA